MGRERWKKRKTHLRIKFPHALVHLMLSTAPIADATVHLPEALLTAPYLVHRIVQRDIQLLLLLVLLLSSLFLFDRLSCSFLRLR
jgi:hypothetical protein